MNKDQLVKWERYLSQMTSRLESAKSGVIPSKHVGHPIQFINFLNNEIRIVKSNIEKAKLGDK